VNIKDRIQRIASLEDVGEAPFPEVSNLQEAGQFRYKCICEERKEEMSEKFHGQQFFVECKICQNKRKAGAEEAFLVLNSQLSNDIKTKEFDIVSASFDVDWW